MIIYKVTNLVNQKVYIGQTINSLEHRKSGHYRDAKCQKKATVYFHNALLKYKPDQFVWEVIDTAETLEELNSKELYWVSYYESNNKEKGYNLKAGGNGGGRCCESTKQKIREKAKVKWNNPEIAERMLEGLKKGHETSKQRALVNFKTTICHCCGKEFTYRPCDSPSRPPKFCSKECLHVFRSAINPGLKIAAKKNHEAKEQERAEIKQKLFDWIPNFDKFRNTPLNKLTPLFDELIPLCGYKDPRTLMLVLGFTSKKAFFKELSKIYAEQVLNQQTYSEESSPSDMSVSS